MKAETPEILKNYIDFMAWYENQVKSKKQEELPDDFTAWVEEVRKQNRLEELIQAIYDKVMADKKIVE